MYYISGFLVGILGSLHCLGMCAPISLAVSNPRFLGHKLIYNSGRVITYSMLGILAGLFGQVIGYGGFQQVISISAGLVLLIIAFLPGLASKLEANGSISGKRITWLKKKMGLFLAKPSAKSTLGLGMVNGLLPCGLVYIALAGAALAGSVTGGVIYMAAFGLGTFPMMLLAASIGKGFFGKYGFSLRKLYPWFVAGLGILFIIRGLDLGIPFLSPEIPGAQATGISDC
jgi:sulfite exporter TauE/SafE